METQKILSLGVVAILVLSIIFISGCVSQKTEPGKPTEETQPAPQGKGTVIFAVTDAAEDMGNISSVNITINKVSVHSINDEWITVSTEEKTFDLLKLKAEGATELLASANLSNGTYNQIRIDIKKTVVVRNGVATEAKLPSGELKIIIKLEVAGGEISTAVLDFIADESLHMTGDGKIIMAPVVKVETKTNASVEIREGNRMEIKGGKVKGNITVGMNENGEVGEGVKIRKGVEIIIEEGKIKVFNISSSKALELAATLDMITNGKAEMKGNNWIITGINANTSEYVEIKINANTGSIIGKTKVNASACEAECKSTCEANILKNCTANCSGNGTVGCNAKAHANCESKCHAYLNTYCEAECKKEAKIDCDEKCSQITGGKGTGGKGPGDTAGCSASCETESINSCKTECITEGKSSCIAECNSIAEAECKANAGDACSKLCKLGEGFRNCYSECAAKC